MEEGSSPETPQPPQEEAGPTSERGNAESILERVHNTAREIIRKFRGEVPSGWAGERYYSELLLCRTAIDLGKLNASFVPIGDILIGQVDREAMRRVGRPVWKEAGLSPEARGYLNNPDNRNEFIDFVAMGFEGERYMTQHRPRKIPGGELRRAAGLILDRIVPPPVSAQPVAR